MSNFATLKAAIQAAVYTNGSGDITGAGLQTVLLDMVDTIGGGYTFKGVATPGTSPGTPDENVFYIGGAGTYTNFGSSFTVLSGYVGIFTYNGSWSSASVKLEGGDVAETVLDENGDSGWQPLPCPLRKGLYSVTWYSWETVSWAGLMLSKENAKADYLITVNCNSNQKNNYICLPFDVDVYALQGTGSKVGLQRISEETISGDLVRQEASYLSGMVGGYVNIAATFVPLSDYSWVYAKLSVTAGHKYLIPYSFQYGAVQPIVGLDAADNIVKTYQIGTQTMKNGYIVFTAETPKIGITYRSLIGGLGSLVDISDVMALPYWDLTAAEGQPYFSHFDYNSQLITDLLPLSFTEVSTYQGGYYDINGNRETTVYGTWNYADIAVDAGEWYLINTYIFSNIRIVDIDGNDNISVNTSVPLSYYDISSAARGSWVLVKPKYAKLGLSFTLTSPNYNPVEIHVPRYTKLTRDKNNGLIMLFLQLYQYVNENTKEGKTIIVNKNGGGDYTSFAEAVLENMGIWGLTIHVEDGVYDLIQELTDYYGTSSFRGLTPSGRGIELGYNITIEASPNAVLVADYLGNDEGMQKSFSPLNCYNVADAGGMTLRGVNIRCSRVRYCVHDEKGTTGTGSYNNVYENCNFYIDNTNNDYWHSSQCIGGGLGTSGSIQIRGCVFEEIEPVNPSNAAVSYHNNAAAGAKSQITCTGNYVKGARGFRFSWYGASTETTEVICCNNSVGLATQYSAETPESVNQNITLYEFNNEVR